MYKNPIISIIMPVFNAELYLKDSIESVIAQSFKEWTLIVIDDCSTDSSVEIIKNFSKSDSRINVFILSKNSGVAVARNTGIEMAQTRYIAFLDSDDIWLEKKLEIQLKKIKASNAAICFSAYYKFTEKITPDRPVEVEKKVTFDMIIKSNYILLSTAIYDVSKCGKVFMPNIKMRNDHGLWINILKQNQIAIGVKTPLVYYRVGHNSLSRNKLVASIYSWRILKVTTQFGFFRRISLFMSYIFFGVKKYFK